MNTLIRSGRVNKWIGKATQFSGLKPFFSVDTAGKLHVAGQAFSELAAFKKMLTHIKKHIEDGKKIKGLRTGSC